VTITQPAQDAVYALGEEVEIRVNASDPDPEGSVLAVDYFNEGYKLTLTPVTNAPEFAIGYTPPTWGDFRLTATGYDDDDTPSFPSNPRLIHILPPIYLEALPASPTSIELNWTTVPNTSTSFRLERRVQGGTANTIGNPPPGPGSYLDGGLAVGTSFYRMTGLDRSNAETALSIEVEAMVYGDAQSDGDGIPDWWEVRYDLDPLTADGNLDSDNDTVSNLIEYLQGRNPRKGAIPGSAQNVDLEVFTLLGP
jgi:hypothetical protein